MRRRPSRRAGQRLLRAADGVRRRRQQDDDRPGGDLRAGTGIIPYDTEEDAIKIANDSAYGLAGSVWTSDVPKGIEISEKIRTGTYAINWYAFDPCCPFGGYKNSGIGRENGPEGVEHFTQQKSVLMPMGYTVEARPSDPESAAWRRSIETTCARPRWHPRCRTGQGPGGA